MKELANYNGSRVFFHPVSQLSSSLLLPLSFSLCRPSLFLSLSLSRALSLLLSLVTADQRESRPTHSPAICSSALFSRGTDGFILITPTLRTSFQVWFIRFKCVRFYLFIFFFFLEIAGDKKHHTVKYNIYSFLR